MYYQHHFNARSNFPLAVALRRGVDIVVGTAGRVSDFIKSTTLRLDQVKYFVCDEADRMLDMGFLPEVKNILSQIPA